MDLTTVPWAGVAMASGVTGSALLWWLRRDYVPRAEIDSRFAQVASTFAANDKVSELERRMGLAEMAQSTVLRALERMEEKMDRFLDELGEMRRGQGVLEERIRGRRTGDAV